MGIVTDFSPSRQSMPIDGRYLATPAAFARARAEAAAVRAEDEAATRAYDLERHAAMLVLTEMIDVHGLESVSRWVRNIAAMTGGRL